MYICVSVTASVCVAVYVSSLILPYIQIDLKTNYTALKSNVCNLME